MSNAKNQIIEEHEKKAMQATADFTKRFMNVLEIPDDQYDARAGIALFFYPVISQKVHQLRNK